MRASDLSPQELELIIPHQLWTPCKCSLHIEAAERGAITVPSRVHHLRSLRPSNIHTKKLQQCLLFNERSPASHFVFVCACESQSNTLIDCGRVSDYIQAPPGGFLHRFSWIKDDDLIGEIPMKWNFLVGWHDKFKEGHPGCVHYTLGGPWYPDYRVAAAPLNDYADKWWEELKLYEATLPCKRMLCPNELYSENGNPPLPGYPNSNAKYDDDEHWLWLGGSFYGGGGLKKICGTTVKTQVLDKYKDKADDDGKNKRAKLDPTAAPTSTDIAV